MGLKYRLALWTAKCAAVALKMTHHKGTDLPGKLALRICPDFAAYIEKPAYIIGITGTNGKTSTTNLIADLLEKDGRSFLCNRAGANCLSGILTCLIGGTSGSGKQRFDTAVFEIDERSARTVFPNIHPDLLLVCNITRDSIMRNAHPAYITNVLTQFMPKKTTLVINANDLMAIRIAPENPRIYFGIDRMATDHETCINLTNDVRICPECHNKLVYDYVRYHHIGKAHCPVCGFASPTYDYRGFDVDPENGTMHMAHGDQNVQFALIGNGIHDFYNMTAAATVMDILGYDLRRTSELMRDLHTVSTRYEVMTPAKGYRVIRQMSKDINAVASTRAFDYVASQPGQKEILMVIFNADDDTMWSENICWMQDCDFEFLNRPEIVNIVCTGPRRADWVLRLVMAGIPKERITVVEDRWQAAKGLRLDGPEDVYVFYGTDAIDLSIAVAESACSEIKERGKGIED